MNNKKDKEGMMVESSRQTNEFKRKRNYWKWAFISLVSIFLIGMVFLWQVTRPIEREDVTQYSPVVPTEEIEIVSSLSKEDIAFIFNSFLEAEAETSTVSYQVDIEDNIKMASTVSFSGLTLPFILTFEPYATEEGNLQLRAESVKIASLSLPVNVLMAALGNQMELPSFIQLNSEDQLIYVDFNEIRNYYPYGIELERVDLENDDIQLKLFINKDTLKRALDSENVESSAIQ